MTQLSIYPSELAELSVGQLAALPADELVEVSQNLDHLLAWTKQVRNKLDAALAQRYGEQAQAVLHTSGRDFGTAHLDDGSVHIKAELPKRVQWDQKHLREIAQRIAAAGDNVEDFLDVKLAVSESRYTNWPPSLREQFAAARTVAPGKPTFTLTIANQEFPQ